MQESLLKNILDGKALERLTNIQYVKPEKYELIKNNLI